MYDDSTFIIPNYSDDNRFFWVNQQGKLLRKAAVTQLDEVLEVYNLKDSTHVVCIGSNGEPKFQISGGYGIPTGIMGFSDIQVTDNANYAVFHGRSFKEIAQNAQKGIEIPDGGQYIFMYSV